jgi:hypothetical protein
MTLFLLAHNLIKITAVICYPLLLYLHAAGVGATYQRRGDLYAPGVGATYQRRGDLYAPGVGATYHQ